MNPLKELIAKLKKEHADLAARQKAALEGAEAEGVSEEDRKKHLAEFDNLQAAKDGIGERLKRAEQLDREEQAAAITPANPPIVHLNNPHPPAAGGFAIPAVARRHGPLRAYKGTRAAERAYEAGLFAAAVLYGHEPSRQRLAEMGVAPMATLNTANNGSAAYFVPDVIDAAIIELTEVYGVIRRKADYVPMSSDTHSSPRWTNGMTSYWVAEGAAPTGSNPAWDEVKLVAKNLAAMTKMTRNLDEDSIIDLGDKLTMMAAIEFARAEDAAGFNGNGTSTYGGIVGLFTKIIDAANAASLYTATGHTTLAALTLADYSAVVGLFPNWETAMPSWMCHKEVWAASMLPLQMAAGGATPADIQGGGKPMFLGYPVEFVNVAPRAASVTTGVTGILFGDLNLSTRIGDRRRRTVERGFENDDFTKQLITILATERVDVVNHTIVDPKDSSKPGPVIGLKLG